MKPLRNGRHEKFAQLVAGGESLGNAYRLVYGVQHRKVRERGYELTLRPGVKARIRALREEASEAVGWSVKSRMRYLLELTKTPIGEMAGGQFCQGVTLTKHGARIHPANKLRAVDLHSRMAGDYRGKKEEPPSADEVVERIIEERRVEIEAWEKRQAAERGTRNG